MIIPVRMPDGIPDYSRLAEWTAVCDSCSARTALGEVADRLISRTQDGHIYCPPCADHSAKQLLTTVFPAGRHRRPARTPAQLRELLGRLVARLPRHGRQLMSAIDTIRVRLVERNAKAHRLTTRSERRCPLHPEHVITPDPTPVKWRCPLGHSVPAADIDLEVSAPAGPEPPARQGDHAGRGSRWPG